MLRVLYIHPIGAFGGASRSLLELVQAFPKGTVEACVIAPRGSAADALERHGLAVMPVSGISRFDTTQYGYYRGLRWLILLRELLFWPATLWALWKARRRWPSIDLVHVNEIVALFPGLIAKALFGKPLVVHIRSVQEQRAARWRRAIVRSLMVHRADAVVAIDETVRSSLPRELPVVVVHNGFSPDRTHTMTPAIEQLRARLPPGALRIGMVGNFLALKGVFDFLEAARIVLHAGGDVSFILVGGSTRRVGPVRRMILRLLHIGQCSEDDIRRYTAEHGLENRVYCVEFTSNVSAVYESLDVLCFPSHLDAVGRPVLEAAWHSLPSIAAVQRPLSDTFVPRETGLQIPAGDPRALAEAILYLARNRNEVRRMGDAALQLARRNFDSAKNAAQMLEIYTGLTKGRRPA